MSVYFLGKDAGLLYIKGICGSLESTVNIEDIYYYGDWNKITTDWNKNTAVSGRNIYYPLFSDLTVDVELEFKFKNNVPTQFIIGYGQTEIPYTIKGAFLKITNFANFCAYYSTPSDNNQRTDISASLTTSTVFKIKTENLNTLKWYLDDVLKVTQNTNTSYPLHLRIDEFTATPMELDYIKVRKL